MHNQYRQVVTSPLSPLELQVLQRAKLLIKQANETHNLKAELPEIRFDLRGQSAGMVKFQRNKPLAIRFNRQLAEKYPEQFLAQTLPHEVAHIVVRKKFGSSVRPHGPEWQAVMLEFGAKPDRCHNYDVSQSRSRKLKRFSYQCGCRVHELTAIRHNRIKRGQVYLCRNCTEPLKAQPMETASQ